MKKKYNFFIDKLYSKDINVPLTKKIWRNIYRVIYKCYTILDEILQLTKIKKDEIDEIKISKRFNKNNKIKRNDKK